MFPLLLLLLTYFSTIQSITTFNQLGLSTYFIFHSWRSRRIRWGRIRRRRIRRGIWRRIRSDFQEIGTGRSWSRNGNGNRIICSRTGNKKSREIIRGWNHNYIRRIKFDHAWFRRSGSSQGEHWRIPELCDGQWSYYRHCVRVQSWQKCQFFEK